MITADDLPHVGATSSGVRRALIGTLIESLVWSGRTPGAYTLWLGFGVPNEAVSRMGLVAETRQALHQLRGRALWSSGATRPARWRAGRSGLVSWYRRHRVSA